MSNSVKTRDSALKAVKRYMTKSADEALTMDSESIMSYLQLLNEQWVRFNTAQDEVEISCGVENVALEENARIQAETWYSTALANFNRVHKCRIESQNNAAKPLVSAPIRLPKMELPSFSGDSTEWVGFHDVFSSLVDRNSALSDVQKLHYLRSCLRGDALKIISGFKICDANYLEAWGLLKSRYKVMRVIVEAHLRALVDVKSALSDSADAIKGVIDEAQQHIRELKALGRPVQFWDDWLVHKVANKLAFETRKQWELSLISDEPPSFEKLIEFLEIRCRSLSMLSSLTASETENAKLVSEITSTNVFHAVWEQHDACTYCNSSHKIYGCEKFRVLDLKEKANFVVQAQLCLNCLSSGHLTDRCNSLSSCHVCKQRHHTLLHGTAFTNNTCSHNTINAPYRFSDAATYPHINVNASSARNPSSSADMLHASACLNTNANPSAQVEKVVLLSTALVKVRDGSGRWQPARLLFDSGSHASFVTEACVNRLGVPQTSSKAHITGIGSVQGVPVRGEVSLSLSSNYSDQSFLINALILPNITNDLPTQAVAVLPWTHTQGLFLADPQFMQPGQIDILIGMDVMDRLICAAFRKGPPGTPMTQLTVFGWTLFGNVNAAVPTTRNLQSLYCDIQPDSALNRLWELNASPERTYLQSEECCYEDLSDLQLRNPPTFAALNELRAERRSASDSQLCLPYIENMQEIADMNHTKHVISTKTFFSDAITLTACLELEFQSARRTKVSCDELVPKIIVNKWLQNHAASLHLTTFKVNCWLAYEVAEYSTQQEAFAYEINSAYPTKPTKLPHLNLSVTQFVDNHVPKSSPLRRRLRHLPIALTSSTITFTCVHLIIASVLHFISNVKANKQHIFSESFVAPNCQKLSKAELCLIKNKNPRYLSKGISLCRAKRLIGLLLSILFLQPLLDEYNKRRAKDRLRNLQIAKFVRHPIIINKKGSFAMITVCHIYSANDLPLCDNWSETGGLTFRRFIVRKTLKPIPEPEGQGFSGNMRHQYVLSRQRCTKWFRLLPNVEGDKVIAVFSESETPHGVLVRPTLNLAFSQRKKTYFSRRTKMSILLIRFFLSFYIEHTKVVQGRRYVEFI